MRSSIALPRPAPTADGGHLRTLTLRGRAANTVASYSGLAEPTAASARGGGAERRRLLQLPYHAYLPTCDWLSACYLGSFLRRFELFETAGTAAVLPATITSLKAVSPRNKRFLPTNNAQAFNGYFWAKQCATREATKCSTYNISWSTVWTLEVINYIGSVACSSILRCPRLLSNQLTVISNQYRPHWYSRRW